MQIIINATIIMTITAVLILLVKGIFREKMAPKWHLLIWSILLVQIVIWSLSGILPTGFKTPESGISLQNYVPTLDKITVRALPDEEKVFAETTSHLDTFVYNGEISMRIPGSGEVLTKEITVNKFWAGVYKDIFLWVWTAGSCFFLLLFWVSYLLFLKKHGKLPAVSHPEVLANFEHCKELLGIRKNIPLKKCVKIPMLAGIFRPVIYISEGYTDEELKYVFIHELCHYKNRDTWINVVSTAFLCLFWFNPVMWICFRTIRKDIEVYCDHRVIAVTAEKKEYATVLLKTATGKNNYIFATSSFLNGEKEVSKRINHIATFKKPKGVFILLVAMTLILLTAACLTRGTGEEKTVPVDIMGGSLAAEVPASWTKDYVTSIDGENDPHLNVNTFYKKGEIFAGVRAERLGSISGNDFTQEDSHFTGEPFTVEEVKEYYVGVKKYQDVNVVQVEQSAEDGEEPRNIFMVSGKSPKGEEETIAINASNNFSNVVYSAWTVNKSVREEQLIKIACSVHSLENPWEYHPVMDIGLDWSIRQVSGQEADIQKDTEALIKMYFEHQAQLVLPRTTDIKEYRINRMEKIGATANEPIIPWDVIYPSAQVYKMEYELIPQDMENYDYREGQNIEKTEEGTALYKNQYGVFYSYNADGEKSEAVFLGLIRSVGTSDLDLQILEKIDDWYQKEVLPEVLETGQIQYIGNHVAVTSLAGRMPLHEYWNGMELQTETEPFGVTIDFDFANNTLIKDKRAVMEKGQDGAVKYNPYIAEQIKNNSIWMLSAIDNAGSITYRVKDVDKILPNAAMSIFAYTNLRKDTELVYCGKQKDITIDYAARTYSPMLSSRKGITFTASCQGAARVEATARIGNILYEGGQIVWQPDLEDMTSVDIKESYRYVYEIEVTAYTKDNRIMGKKQINIMDVGNGLFRVL